MYLDYEEKDRVRKHLPVYLNCFGFLEIDQGVMNFHQRRDRSIDRETLSDAEL